MTQSGQRGYRLVKGLTRTKSTPPGPPPVFEPIPSSAALADFASGTLVRMKFGDGTNCGNLSNTFYNSTRLWQVIFRSYTAEPANNP
jgi:hypothetical protein